jgi:hypothetical protein
LELRMYLGFSFVPGVEVRSRYMLNAPKKISNFMPEEYTRGLDQMKTFSKVFDENHKGFRNLSLRH